MLNLRAMALRDASSYRYGDNDDRPLFLLVVRKCEIDDELLEKLKSDFRGGQVHGEAI